MSSKVQLYVETWRASGDVKINFLKAGSKVERRESKPCDFDAHSEISIQTPGRTDPLRLRNITVLSESDLDKWLAVGFRFLELSKASKFVQTSKETSLGVPACYLLDECFRGRTSYANSKSVTYNTVSTQTEERVPASKSKATKSISAEENLCSICFGPRKQKSALLQSCRHEFCFECLRYWLKAADICPQCRRPNSAYLICQNGQVLCDFPISPLKSSKAKGQIKEQSDFRVKLDDDCYKCQKSENEFMMIVCDDCDQTVCHVYCLNPPLEYIPEGDWICDKCLSKRRKGRKKRG